MKIAETNTTIGALIERLKQTGKPLATKELGAWDRIL